MPGNPLTDPNWADDTTDTIVGLVGTVRDKATVPLVHAARALVYGIIAAFLGVFAAILGLVMLTRAMQAGLDWQFDHEQSVYISYLLLGGIFCLIGLFFFKKRNADAG